MSDSRHKENDEAAKAGKTPGLKATSPAEKQKVTAASLNAREQKGKTWPIWILSATVIIALAGFGWVLANQWLNSQNGEVGRQVASNSASPSIAGNEPMSLLPDDADGVTILQKQPEEGQSEQTASLAPVAQGADIATGFAMDLGAAESFLELSRRFAQVAALNGPENFQRLEPRAILRDTVTGLEARLLVGPFETKQEANEACAVLVLDPNLACAPADFEGELISRE